MDRRMTADLLGILAEIASHRLTLKVLGNRIEYRGPKAALTGDLKARLRPWKFEMLGLLRDPGKGCRELWHQAIDAVADAYSETLEARRAEGLPGELPGLDQGEDDRYHEQIRQAILAGDLLATVRIAAYWRGAWRVALTKKATGPREGLEAHVSSSTGP